MILTIETLLATSSDACARIAGERERVRLHGAVPSVIARRAPAEAACGAHVCIAAMASRDGRRGNYCYAWYLIGGQISRCFITVYWKPIAPQSIDAQFYLTILRHNPVRVVTTNIAASRPNLLINKNIMDVETTGAARTITTTRILTTHNTIGISWTIRTTGIQIRLGLSGVLMLLGLQLGILGPLRFRFYYEYQPY